MSKINSNPLEGMGESKMSFEDKVAKADFMDIQDIGIWLRKIIEVSDSSMTKPIMQIHMELYRILASKGLLIPVDTNDSYRAGFIHLVNTSGKYLFNPNTLEFSLNHEVAQEMDKKKQIQQKQKALHTVDLVPTLVLTREKKQYRRVRRKITFIHDKVLIDPIVAEGEKDLVELRIRNSESSDPSSDKIVIISNQIRNTLKALSDLSSSATMERNSTFLATLYRELLDEIEMRAGGKYLFEDMYQFFSSLRSRTYTEYETSMRKIYAKVGAKAPKNIGFKVSPSIIGENVHEYLMSDLPDAIYTRELMEHYNLINIV